MIHHVTREGAEPVGQPVTIDDVGPYSVRGWRRAGEDELRLMELWRGDERLSSGPPSIQERPDVLAAGAGGLLSGFLFGVPALAPVRAGDTLSLRHAQTGEVLARWTVEHLAPPADLCYGIDVWTESRVAGWAMWPDAPLRRARLLLRSGDRIVARTVANGFRPDLQRMGDGYYAFEMMPPSVDVDSDAGLRLVEEESGREISFREPMGEVPRLSDWLLARELVPPTMRDGVETAWRYTTAPPGFYEPVRAHEYPLGPLTAVHKYLLERRGSGESSLSTRELAVSLLTAVDAYVEQIHVEVKVSDAVLERLGERSSGQGAVFEGVTRFIETYREQYRPALALHPFSSQLAVDFTFDVACRWNLDSRLIPERVVRQAMTHTTVQGGAVPALFAHVRLVPADTEGAPVVWDWLLPGGLLFGRLGALDFLPAPLKKQYDRAIEDLSVSGEWRTVCRLLGWPVHPEVWESATGKHPTAPHLPVVDGTDVPFVRVITNEPRDSGLGRNVVHTLSALRLLGLPHRLFRAEDFESDWATEPGRGNAINLFHVQPDSLPLVWTRVPSRVLRSKNIGFFLWELPALADVQGLGVSLVDEIWTATEFTRLVFQSNARAPVHAVGHAVEPAPPSARDFRRELGIGDEYVFLFSFDSNSGFERKNPAGVLHAFREAMRRTQRQARLILKTTPPRHGVATPAQRSVEALAGEIPGVIVLDERMSEADCSALLSGCDCYVSLHRAEGFGYTVAEAMAFGRPVIATGYSGTLDFCNAETGFMVAFERRAVRKSDFIYEVPGSWWAAPDLVQAAEWMQRLIDDPPLGRATGERGANLIRGQFGVQNLSRRYGKLLKAPAGDQSGCS